MDFATYTSSDLLEVFRESDDFRDDILDELLSRISTTTLRYSHLLPTDTSGILTQQHFAGLIMNERLICHSKHLLRPSEQVEREMMQWAMHHKCWWTEDDIRRNSDERSMYSRGTECVVYVDCERRHVIKMMHPREGYDTESLGEMLEGMALFNMVFRGAPCRVIGYGYNDADVFCAIFKQPVIKGKTLTKLSEENNLGEKWIISRYEEIMLKRGFEKRQDCWYKDQYLVTDITGSNVVVTQDNHAIVVDADVSYRDESFFGDTFFEE